MISMVKDKNFRFYWEESREKDEPRIKIELPGFAKDEIKVSIDKGYVNILAEKKKQKIERGKDFYREETFQQSSSRLVSIPEGLNPEDLGIKIQDSSVEIKRKKKKRIEAK